MKWLTLLIAWVGGLWGQKNLDPLAGYVMPTITNDKLLITNLPEPTKKIILKLKPTGVGDTFPWGVARQVGEDTWTMKIGMDARMATPPEILKALNEYRVRRGSQNLTWNESLATYAQTRADYLASIKNVDGHKGFNDFLNNQNGFEKLGFTWLGENISYGYRMEALHLIEWIYAGDKPHDDNQVNNRWNYVGVGVKGTATSIIFGTGKR